jgi:hypothetical protein
LKNANSGVDVQGSGSLANINLGVGGDFGHNTLQAAAPNNNTGAGICNETTNSLDAQGNLFNGIDCSQATPGAVTKGSSCTTGSFDISVTSSGTINATNCTQ